MLFNLNIWVVFIFILLYSTSSLLSLSLVFPSHHHLPTHFFHLHLLLSSPSSLHLHRWWIVYKTQRFSVVILTTIESLSWPLIWVEDLDLLGITTCWIQSVVVIFYGMCHCIPPMISSCRRCIGGIACHIRKNISPHSRL